MLFLVVLVATAGAQETFGTTGFLVTSFLSGIILSGSTTATAVTLTATGSISNSTTALGVLVGTLSSILVKIGFAVSINRRLLAPVALKSLVLIGAGVLGAALTVQFA